jgi:hypothetical protein
MARLITAGAETKSDTLEVLGASGGAGTRTYDTGTVRSGAVSVKLNSGAGNAACYSLASFTTSLGTTYYLRAYFNFTTLPTAVSTFLVTIAGPLYRVTIKSDNKLYLQNSGTDIGSPSSALLTDTWYRIEIAWKIDTGALDYAELMLDGVSVASEVNVSRTDSVATGINLGLVSAPGANIVCYVDDVAFNDSSGGSQNSWPDAAKVVLLLPTADSAKGTGWTNDAASTPNLFNSVDNTPPIGIADTSSGTGLNQLRNATSNANSNYDANLTTYTTAGIASGDTINVLDPIVATAAPVTTSSKQGTVGVSANPVIANVALSATGTAGAFWAGATAGTYAVGWKASHGTATYAPSVTLGSSPVLRITQVTSSTRIAMVCFMGMYVDYTPAAVTQVPYTSPMPPLLAQ